MWGDSDVRYEYNQCPKSHYLDAFKYSVWKGEKAFAQALLWADEGLEGVTVKLDDLTSEEGVIPASAMKAQFVKYVWPTIILTAMLSAVTVRKESMILSWLRIWWIS